MSVLGIIAEYNPFHNGHAYQIKKAKELSGCDTVVVIMSGNYVQRGIPAIYPKYDRAVLAIENGADLVIELPVVYSSSTAQVFAFAAVKTLMKLGIVDCISFGCENDNLGLYYKIAEILNNEPEEYKELLKSNLNGGNRYANARSLSIQSLLGQEASEILNNPNGILGVEYIRAILEFNFKVDVVAIKRCDSGYNDPTLKKDYSSATSIRNYIIECAKNTDDITNKKEIDIKDIAVPQNVKNYIMKNKYIKPEDYSDFIAYKLFSNDSYSKYFEIDNDLSNKILKLNKIKGLEDTAEELLSKNETKSHIYRSLLHIMLGITKEDIKLFVERDYIMYFNVLAASTAGTELLSKIKESSDIPVINKFGKFFNEIKEDSALKKMLDISLFADKLYDYIYFRKYGTYPHNDYMNTIFKKDTF